MRTRNSVGAVLVPGKRWAPSWLAWRTGGRYIGWALLPHEVDRIHADLLSVCRLRAGLDRPGVEPALPPIGAEEQNIPTVAPDTARPAKKRKER